MQPMRAKLAKKSIARTSDSDVPAALSAPMFTAAAWRQLRAGDVLFSAGDPGDGCYRLDHGLLKVMVTSPAVRSASSPCLARALSSANWR